MFSIWIFLEKSFPIEKCFGAGSLLTEILWAGAQFVVWRRRAAASIIIIIILFVLINVIIIVISYQIFLFSLLRTCVQAPYVNWPVHDLKGLARSWKMGLPSISRIKVVSNLGIAVATHFSWRAHISTTLCQSAAENVSTARAGRAHSASNWRLLQHFRVSILTNLARSNVKYSITNKFHVFFLLLFKL